MGEGSPAHGPFLRWQELEHVNGPAREGRQSPSARAALGEAGVCVWWEQAGSTYRASFSHRRHPKYKLMHVTRARLCFTLSGECFYSFNSMPGRVRDQLAGKTAHQRLAELDTTLSVSDLANRRTQERPKGTLKARSGLGTLKCFSSLQIIWKSSGGSKPSGLYVLPMCVLT